MNTPGNTTQIFWKPFSVGFIFKDQVSNLYPWAVQSLVPAHFSADYACFSRETHYLSPRNMGGIPKQHRQWRPLFANQLFFPLFSNLQLGVLRKQRVFSHRNNLFEKPANEILILLFTNIATCRNKLKHFLLWLSFYSFFFFHLSYFLSFLLFFFLFIFSILTVASNIIAIWVRFVTNY